MEPERSRVTVMLVICMSTSGQALKGGSLSLRRESGEIGMGYRWAMEILTTVSDVALTGFQVYS